MAYRQFHQMPQPKNIASDRSHRIGCISQRMGIAGSVDDIVKGRPFFWTWLRYVPLQERKSLPKIRGKSFPGLLFISRYTADCYLLSRQPVPAHQHIDEKTADQTAGSGQQYTGSAQLPPVQRQLRSHFNILLILFGFHYHFPASPISASCPSPAADKP